MADWKKIRADFPITEGLVYFQSAGMSPISKQVLKKVIDRYTEFANSADANFPDDLNAYKSLVARIASIINAAPDDIAIIQNTSTAMSLIAMSLKNTIKKPFNIVSMDAEFPSSTVPFEYQGINVRYVKSKNARYPIDSIMDRIDKETAAVVSSHVQYATGFRQDIKILGEKLRERRILFIVNATQSFPIFPIDAEAMHIDALTASVHKWGMAGYHGSIFYTSPKFREKHPTPMAGWLSVDTGGELVYTEKGKPINLHKSARCYMFGSSNFQLVGALDTALEYVQSISKDEICEQIFHLADMMLAGLTKAGAKIISPINDDAERSAIIAFDPKGQAEKCVEYLKAKGIHTASRGGWVRASINIFNDESDVKKLCDEVGSFIK